MLGVILYAQCIRLPDVKMPGEKNEKGTRTDGNYAIRPIPMSNVVQPCDERACNPTDNGGAD